MFDGDSSESKQTAGALEFRTPLLERSWAYMPEGIRQSILINIYINIYVRLIHKN